MVIGEASDGRNALQMIFYTQPDLVILNAQLPERDGLEVAKIIEEHRVAPVILIAIKVCIAMFRKLRQLEEDIAITVEELPKALEGNIIFDSSVIDGIVMPPLCPSQSMIQTVPHLKSTSHSIVIWTISFITLEIDEYLPVI